MRLDRTFLIAILFFGSWTSEVTACEKLNPITAESQTLLDTLENEGAKANQRLFALVELACISDATIREKALETAIKSSDRTLKAKAFSELLMQREGLRAQLTPIKWTPGYAHKIVEDEGWTINFRFHKRSKERNCINLVNGREPCFQEAMMVIDGTQIRVNDAGRYLSGEFTLEKNYILKGFITLRGNPPASATIELFSRDKRTD